MWCLSLRTSNIIENVYWKSFHNQRVHHENESFNFMFISLCCHIVWGTLECNSRLNQLFRAYVLGYQGCDIYLSSLQVEHYYWYSSYLGILFQRYNHPNPAPPEYALSTVYILQYRVLNTIYDNVLLILCLKYQNTRSRRESRFEG